MKNIYIFFIFFISISSIQRIQSGQIIPDSQNPILVFYPNYEIKGQKIYLNFQLPSNSLGLGYKQFIAVQFPSISSFLLDMKDLNTPMSVSTLFSCNLFDYSNPSYNITVTPIVSNQTSDFSTLFCRLDDLTTTLNANASYQLTLNFLSINLSYSKAVSQIGIFTSSSIVSDRIIFDYNPCFADMAMYPNYANPVLPSFQITNLTTSITPLTLLTTFDLTLTLVANSQIDGSSSVFILKWDNSIISNGPSNILSSGVNSIDPLKSAYIPTSGSLSINSVPGQTNAIFINGITDTIIINRSFNLIFKSLKTSDLPYSQRLIELYVYYDNCYSVISYSNINLTTVPNSITNFSVKSFDQFPAIYQGGSWNLQIQFTLNTAMNIPGYVVIQHNNAKVNSNKINLLASTCDFSYMNSNTLITQSFGTRPICSPLRTDFNYPNVSTNNVYNGSGIFFKIPSIMATTYTLNVFGFSEWCVPVNVKKPTNPSTTIYAAFGFENAKISDYYNFNIQLFGNVDPTISNENRFNLSYLIGSNISSPLNGVKCYGTHSSINNEAYSSIDAKNTAGLNFNDSYTYSATSVFLYKEINDFQLPYYTSNSVNSCRVQSSGLPCMFEDLNNANSYYALGSLLNTDPFKTNSVWGASYLAVLGFVSTVKITNYMKLCNYIACAKYNKQGTYTSLTNYKLQINLANGLKMFSLGDDPTLCYFSWGLTVNIITGDVNTANWSNSKTSILSSFQQTNLLNQITTPNTPADTVVLNGTRILNIIAAGSGNGVTGYDFDLYGVNIPSTGAPINLTSAIVNSNVSFPNELSNTAQLLNTNTGFFAIYSSCIKWTNSQPNFTSPNNYIDIQFNVLEKADTINYIPTKINRFIKFIVDSFVLDYSKYTTTALAQTGPGDIAIYFHTINFPNTVNSNQLSYPMFSNNGVCMLQINNEFFSSTNTSLLSTTNTLLIFLTHLTLLEMDITDVTSSYPTSSNLPAYALNSVPFFIGSLSVSTTTSTTVPTFQNYPWWIIDYGWMNNQPSLTPLNTSIKTDTRSLHKAFLGSTLWIDFSKTSLGTALNTNNDLFFPIFCPVLSNSNQNYTPLVQITFVVSNGFSVSMIDRSWSPPSNYVNMGCSTTSKYCMTSFFSSPPAKTTLSTPVSTNENPIYTNLRFNSYNIQNVMNVLYLIPNSPTIINTATPLTANYACTGFNLFLNSSLIRLDPSISTYTLSINKAVLNTTSPNFASIWPSKSQNKIYLFGKPFNKVHMLVQNADTYIPTTTNSNYYTGILRPSAESMIITNSLGVSYLNPIDNIAFYCQSKYSDPKIDNSYFTNYVSSIPSSNGDILFKSFMLDWNPMAVSLNTGSIGPDKSETAFYNDPAGNIKLSIMMPTGINLPGKGTTIIRFSLNSLFGSNTICGIQQSSSTTAFPCPNTISTNNSFDCPINSTETNLFTICCYGVLVNVDPIYFPNPPNGSFNIIFNQNSSQTNLSKYLNSQVYTLNWNPVASWITGNASNTSFNMLSGIFKITNITYKYIFQESAFTRASILISLPREPIRNSLIIIKGDFSVLMIGSYGTPRCSVSFSINNPNYMQGDGFVESCIYTNTGITIAISNKIFKCSSPFSKSMYINLWPVFSINWVNLQSKLYSVSIVYNSISIIPSTQFPITYVGKPLSALVATNNINNLCNLSINPPIIGEMGDYTFSFDLSSIANSSIIPNEFFIFFPHKLYNLNVQGITSQITCFYGSSAKPITCSTLEENWLKISVVYPISLSSIQIITITGIINPYSISTISFTCSANFYDSYLGIRTTIINGQGTASAINYDDPTKSGYLRLISISSSGTEPRIRNNVSTINVKVGVDVTFNELNQIPTIILNGNFLITLPYPDYNFSWYFNNAPVITFTEYNTISTGIVSTSLPINYSIPLSNRLSIFLNQPRSISIGNFNYWIISISNIYQPNDEIKISTGRFRVTLLSSNNIYVFRSYSNLSNVSNNPLLTNFDTYSQNLISSTRGLTYFFNSSKYIIDITNCSIINPSSPQLVTNYIFLRTGRANNCYFTLRNPTNNLLLPPLNIMISLNDPYSKFIMSPSYNISFYTSRTSQPFFIGAPCGTPTGTYYIHFNLSDTVNFYPIPPIPVLIDPSETVGVASSPAIGDVARGGVAPVIINLSDYTIDSLIYQFTPLNSSTGSNGSINNIIVNPFNNSSSGFFQINSTVTSGVKNFTTPRPNICFSPNLLNITVNITKQPIIFDQNKNNITLAFSNYFNSDTDKNKKTLRNSVQLTFTPPAQPIFLYCVFLCNNLPYPSTNSIISGNVTVSPLTKYYQGYFGSLNSTILWFNNLVRGQQYKMKCVSSSTQSNIALRSTDQVTFDIFTPSSTSIIVSPPLTPSCVTYIFSSNPSNSLKQSMLNYCQNFFSIMPNINSPINSNPACIKCIDSDLNLTIGWNFTNNTNCLIPKLKDRLLKSSSNKRFLQSSPTSNNDKLTQFPYVVCPIQDLVCGYDNVTIVKSYNSYFSNDFFNSLKTPNDFLIVLNQSNVIINQTFIVTDANPPVIVLTTSAKSYKSFTGEWSVVVSNPTITQCYFKMYGNLTKPAIPSSNDIKNCIDISVCSMNIILNSGTKITSNPNNLVVFNQSYYYCLYMVCYNYIPNAQNASNVTEVWSFSISNSNNSNSNSSTNNTTILSNNSNCTKTNTTNCYSNKWNISSILSVLLIFLVFI